MHKALTWLLLLLAVTGLIAALDADPSRLLWRDFITDEGWWTGEARDRALFGEWVLDEYNQGLSTPLASWTWRLAFQFAGVSLWTARLPGALASLLTLLLLGLLTRLLHRNRPSTGPAEIPAAVLPSLLLAAAIPFAMHARVAMPEPLALLFVTAAWLSLALGSTQGAADSKRDRNPLGWFLLAGFLFGAALSAKFAVIVAWPALAWIAHRQRGEAPGMPWPGRWRPALHFTFGAVLTWRLLRLPFELRFPREIAALDRLHRGENLPDSLIDALANIAYFPWPAPFLYQVAPLVALAGFGAWQLRFSLRGRGAGAQALAFLMLTSLAQCCLNYPADRRFLVFLPALALLAARGAVAILRGEEPGGSANAMGERVEMKGRLGRAPWLRAAAAALALAFVLPGRLALWLARLLDLFGRPMADFRIRGLAALLFVGVLAVALLLLLRRPRWTGGALRAGLLIGWLIVCLEPLDLLIVAGLGELAGRYDASRLWLENGRWWSLPWGALTLALVWIPLSRSGALPRLPALERSRRWLPFAAPLIALLWLAPTWMRPAYSLKSAAAELTLPIPGGGPCRAVVGAEAPTLILGTAKQSVPIRDEFNSYWLDHAPPGTRFVRLIEDSGFRHGGWPAGADSLGVCHEPDGRPRFLFAVWNVQE